MPIHFRHPPFFFSGGGCTGTATTCVVTMDAAKTVTATFVDFPTLTVTKSGTGTGTVTSTAGGLNCGATCTRDFPKDSNVTLTAVPASGSVFAGFTGSGCAGNATTCIVTMAQARSVTATFVLVGDRINDPGNAGTMLRSAEAAGVEVVVLEELSRFRQARVTNFIPILDRRRFSVAARRASNTEANRRSIEEFLQWASGRTCPHGGSGLGEPAGVDRVAQGGAALLGGRGAQHGGPERDPGGGLDDQGVDGGHAAAGQQDAVEACGGGAAQDHPDVGRVGDAVEDEHRGGADQVVEERVDGRHAGGDDVGEHALVVAAVAGEDLDAVGARALHGDAAVAGDR